MCKQADAPRGTVSIVELSSTQTSTTPPKWDYTIKAQITAGTGETVQPHPMASVLRGNGTEIKPAQPMTLVPGEPTFNYRLDDDCDEDPIDGKVVAIFQKPQSQQQTFPYP